MLCKRTFLGREQAKCSDLNHAEWQDRREQDGGRSDGRESRQVPTDEDVKAGSAARKEMCIRGRDQG